MKVFVINGFPGSGKTTMEEYCVNYLNQFDKYKNKVHIISSVDSVKQIAKQIGWNGVKTAEDRKFLSDLKKLLKNYNDLESKYPDIAKEFNIYKHSFNIGAYCCACGKHIKFLNKYERKRLKID